MQILNSIEEAMLKEKDKERKGHYPSGAYKCRRELFYDWKKVKQSNPIDLAALWRFEIANGIHDRFKSLLEAAGYECEAEVGGEQEVPGLKYPFRYRVDLLFKVDGELRGGEIKTSYGQGIKRIQEEQAPREHELKQVVVYAHLTGIPIWHMLYVGRDNAYRTEFVVEVDLGSDTVTINGLECPVSFAKIVERLAVLEGYLQENTLPPRDFRAAIKNGEVKNKFQKDLKEYRSDWQCMYCSWRDHCWRNEIVETQMGGSNAHMWYE